MDYLGDFLGTGYVASQNRRYRPFEEARQWARAQGLKTEADWKELAANKGLPVDIPSMKQVYAGEWRGVGDFLGTNVVAPSKRTYRSLQRRVNGREPKDCDRKQNGEREPRSLAGYRWTYL
jgi:hypothetical protein